MELEAAEIAEHQELATRHISSPLIKVCNRLTSRLVSLFTTLSYKCLHFKTLTLFYLPLTSMLLMRQTIRRKALDTLTA